MTELEELRSQFDALCFALVSITTDEQEPLPGVDVRKQVRVLSDMRDKLVMRINTIEWG